MGGSLVLVHGTGVRLASFMPNVALVAQQMRSAGIDRQLIPCAWGDPLGVIFEGKSLPDLPDGEMAEKKAQEIARWSWLFDDPLAELDMLSIRSARTSSPPPPGTKPTWMVRLEAIENYRPSDELQALLSRGDLSSRWDHAFLTIVRAPIVRFAFERSEEAHELADAGIALARAVVAQLHVEALDQGHAGLSATLRSRLFDRIAQDWGWQVYGLSTLLAGFAKRVGTKVLRRRRNAFNAAIAAPIGDILLYQSRGQEIREFIRTKIDAAPKPVAVIAHSLGGIACVDLLAMPNAPKVDRLITVGSQSPYFYEIDALASIKSPQPLPIGFPKWLNVFDRNDFLSFVGGRLFEKQVEDFEVASGLAFPDSHGAYLGDEMLWTKVKGFLGQ